MEKAIKYINYNMLCGEGEGNRTLVCSLGSWYSLKHIIHNISIYCKPSIALFLGSYPQINPLMRLDRVVLNHTAKSINGSGVINVGN